MIYTGFLLGLLGSFHCVGMCGPIALILPVSKESALKKSIQIALYHLGRITTYSLLGLIFGLVGKGLQLATMQQQISIAIGVIMIAFVVFPKITQLITFKASPLTHFFTQLKIQMGLYLKKESYYALFLIGFFNGFLPCGMIYMALVGAIAMPNISSAMLYMIVFGLGTVPLLSIVIYVKDAFSTTFRKKIKKVIPLVVILIGILFILRGLGLGIPYVSPKESNLYLFTNPTDCTIN